MTETIHENVLPAPWWCTGCAAEGAVHADADELRSYIGDLEAQSYRASSEAEYLEEAISSLEMLQQDVYDLDGNLIDTDVVDIYALEVARDELFELAETIEEIVELAEERVEELEEAEEEMGIEFLDANRKQKLDR